MWLPLVALLVGCKGSDVWDETSVAFDPDCSTCTSLGRGMLDHVGEVEILIDTEVDDPPAQWARCTGFLVDCIDSADAIDLCMDEAPCPRKCVKRWRKEARGLDDLGDRLDAIDAVFFAADGLCAAPAYGGAS